MENNERRQRGYWNYETCLEAAKKCGSINEFNKTYRTAYKMAKNNGWIKEYLWFKRPVVYNKKWDKESCYIDAKKYKTRSEFAEKNRSAYNIAKKNGWTNDYTWFLSEFDARSAGNLGKGVKWTSEKCYNEAKKYKTLVEFRDNNICAHYAAYRNGWLKDYDWLEKPMLPDKPIYVVYRYYDKDTNTVYVGLAKDMKRRHREHCRGVVKHGERKYDVVNNFFVSIGKKMPEPTILIDNLYAEDAQKYEGEYIEKYKNEGFNVLNLAKAGSLGAYNSKWTKEACYNEAKKYNSRTEFQKKARGAYKAALKNEWMNDYVWFIKLWEKKWDYETCYAEAKKYKSRSEFDTNNASAYNAARQNGWLNDYTWMIPPITIKKWTYETCYNEAKKYQSKAEFRAKSSSAYQISKKNGWIGEYTWFTRPVVHNKKWDYDSCKEEASKYDSRREFKKNGKGRVYNVCCENGWLDEFFPKSK